MSDKDKAPGTQSAPNERQDEVVPSIASYVTGFVLAAGLTATSFWVATTDVFWAPGVVIGLCVLGIAQMGVHLVFFLHVTSGPDNTNNVLALAFGTLIVVLVGAGSLWIMANLNANMMPMDRMTDLHKQR